MLTIKDLTDLKKYLETRRKMTENAGKAAKVGSKSEFHAKGALYAWDESIKAVEALIASSNTGTKAT